MTLQHRPWWRWILGFRRGSWWRMIVAGTVYSLIAIAIVASIIMRDWGALRSNLGLLVLLLFLGLLGNPESLRQRRAGRSSVRSDADTAARQLSLARNFAGMDEGLDLPINLRNDERAFWTDSAVQLYEPQRSPGKRTATPQISFHLGPITFTPGGQRERYTPTPETLTALDTGILIITNRRVVFQGVHNTREWPFATLIGNQHHPQLPATSFHDSKRRKVSAVRYMPDLQEEFRFFLELALAHFSGRLPQLIERLEAASNRRGMSNPTASPELHMNQN